MKSLITFLTVFVLLIALISCNKNESDMKIFNDIDYSKLLNITRTTATVTDNYKKTPNLSNKTILDKNYCKTIYEISELVMPNEKEPTLLDIDKLNESEFKELETVLATRFLLAFMLEKICSDSSTVTPEKRDEIMGFVCRTNPGIIIMQSSIDQEPYNPYLEEACKNIIEKKLSYESKLIIIYGFALDKFSWYEEYRYQALRLILQKSKLGLLTQFFNI